MKALLLAARYPWPPLRGDQMRACDFVAGLESMGAEVEVLCAGEPSERSAIRADGAYGPSQVAVEVLPPRWDDRLRGGLAWPSGEPLQAAAFRSRRLIAATLNRLVELGRGDVVVVQLVRQKALLAAIVEALARRPSSQRPRVVVDLIDALSLNFERRALLDAWWLRPLWRSEAKRLRRAEERVVELADAVSVVCQRDLDELIRIAPAAATKGLVVPLPVEMANESPEDKVASAETAVIQAAAVTQTAAGHQTTEVAEAAERTEGSGGGETIEAAGENQTVVLTGNLGYFVNHQATSWFVRQVWPLVQEGRPNARLVVAGARPRAKLRRLIEDAGGVLQADPPDLRAVLRKATVAVAPLAGGAGVPVKVLEAWAEGVPMVVSAWAAAGVAGPGESEEALDEVLVRLAEDSGVRDWANAVVDLLEDRELIGSLVCQGRRRVKLGHGLVAFQDGLEGLVTQSLSGRDPRLRR